MEFNTLADEGAIQRVVAALESQGNISVTVVDTEKQALETLIEWVPPRADVYTGTSATLDQIGFAAYVRDSGRYHDLRAAVAAEPDMERRREVRRQTYLAEYFVGSVHGIAETGEVVVASMSGSQLTGYVAGARNVVWVAGTNKIVPTLEDAIRRTREHTLPLEDARMKATGAQGSRVGKLMIFEREGASNRIRLLLVRRALGF